MQKLNRVKAVRARVAHMRDGRVVCSSAWSCRRIAVRTSSARVLMERCTKPSVLWGNWHVSYMQD
eukprot:2956431-Pleurochrysis_carterae.AAC.1